jgi:hypothetical protein
MKHLFIVLGQSDSLTLKFQIRDTPVARLWVNRMQSREDYPLDHPKRFYGFDTPEQEQARAADIIQQCITTINSHLPIITRPFEYTQDCLNYLHNIFEKYHGLLDQQHTQYWNTAPWPVQRALAELNIAVHRCETALAPGNPRLVCTWFGMPKTERLNTELQQKYGTSEITFGTVYLNYCEIGKTAEDLAQDNDKYIADEAFKPFDHYSADFNVQFGNRSLLEKYADVDMYIRQHRYFFLAHGIKNVYNIKAQPLRFPVADLEYSGNKNYLLEKIAQRQQVQQVTIQ